MRGILALLLFFSFSFAYFGNATIAVEKQWIITGNPSEIRLTGLFLVNDSNHRVLEVYAEEPLEIRTDGDRLLAVYNGSFNGSAVFRAKGVVAVGYDTAIKLDEPLHRAPVRQEGLVDYDESMAMLARNLADNSSSLATLISLSNWISDNIDYDLSYSGRFLPAKTVFLERSGVCAEYVHLFIALVNSLGFEARYVAGYVISDGQWQPHSWAEVYVDGQWVPFDPTFRQAGILDNSHVAVSYGKDADSVFDRIESYGDADLETSTDLEMKDDGQRKNDAVVDFVFSLDEKKGVISIRNLRGDYLLGSYSRMTPDENGGEEKKVIFMRPYGVYEEDYLLGEDLEPGYSYSIPIIVSFNDAEKVERVKIEVKNSMEEKDRIPSTCSLAFAMIAALALFWKLRDTQKTN